MRENNTHVAGIVAEAAVLPASIYIGNDLKDPVQQAQCLVGDKWMPRHSESSAAWSGLAQTLHSHDLASSTGNKKGGRSPEDRARWGSVAKLDSWSLLVRKMLVGNTSIRQGSRLSLPAGAHFVPFSGLIVFTDHTLPSWWAQLARGNFLMPSLQLPKTQLPEQPFPKWDGSTFSYNQPSVRCDSNSIGAVFIRDLPQYQCRFYLHQRFCLINANHGCAGQHGQPLLWRRFREQLSWLDCARNQNWIGRQAGYRSK